MRNKFTYKGFSKDVLKALLYKSNDVEYISILCSNSNLTKNDFPKNYITYDIIAGVGFLDKLGSNQDSFNKLYNFHSNNKDWLFGYLSYDLKNEEEDELISNNEDNFKFDNLFFFIPEFVLLLKDRVLEIHTFNTKTVTDNFVSSFIYEDFFDKYPDINFLSRDKKLDYISKINRIKEHIQRGDIYEMNYCQEFYAKDVSIKPTKIFYDLNKAMSTPFSSFLKLKNKYILSASPERFLRKNANQILSQPIKGTRKRGKTLIEDSALLNELKVSSKDISENIMITDLVRNDLSVTAKSGSVKVYELCKVYTFEKVHQMITSISSEIDVNMRFTDVLKSAFPMGSMTGAPKLRAMQIIEEFESFKRGIFSGSVGYINPESDFDFNVVIRTILYNMPTKYISIGVGGAITIRSEALDEYEECLVKVEAIFDILNFKIK